MTENLSIWNAVCRPPESALKKITGGRLKDMTDINPQWRIQMMTEKFGPIGIGWYYEVLNKWTAAGANDELLCFVDIHLYIKRGDEWSKPIYGIGGSKLVGQESRGLHNNDEGYKMATTDALSVAMKELGVAADIYKGLWNGSKYITDSPSADIASTREAIEDEASNIFSDGVELPKDYPEFNRLVAIHKGKNGINDLRAVASEAKGRKWSEEHLLSWITEQDVDLENGAKTSDFAKLLFTIKQEA